MCGAAEEIALLVRRSRKKPAGCTTLLLPATATDNEPPGILANNFLSLELQSILAVFQVQQPAAPRAGGLFVSVGRGGGGWRWRGGWAGTGPGVGPGPCQAQPASLESGQRPVLQPVGSSLLWSSQHVATPAPTDIRQ